MKNFALAVILIFACLVALACSKVQIDPIKVNASVSVEANYYAWAWAQNNYYKNI